MTLQHAKVLKPNSIYGDVIIGFFDIIHKGHEPLLINKKASIITFYEIPRKVSINHWTQRVENLANYGFENIYLVEQSELDLTAQVFVDKYLKHCTKVIVGDDFHFGSDFKPITLFADQLKLELISYDNDYSTTKIKQALIAGDFDTVNQLIGRPYSISYVVSHGNQVGRTLGFPTINFNLHNNNPIGAGIYYSNTIIAHKQYKSVSVMIIHKKLKTGFCNVLETHIIDFEKDLYGQVITVIMLKKIGEMQKFKNSDELKNSIQNYVSIVRNM